MYRKSNTKHITIGHRQFTLLCWRYIVSFFFSPSFWYVFFYTRPKFSKWSISASILSPEDFRTTDTMYFFVGNSFAIDIRTFEHSMYHFECVRAITSPSNDRLFSEISLLFIDFDRISFIFFDFYWFSLIFVDFHWFFGTPFDILMTLTHPN